MPPPGGICGAALLGSGLSVIDGLGGQDHRRDRRRVLDRRPGHLGRIDDARVEHVHVLAGHDVVADARILLLGLRTPHVLDDDVAVESGVLGQSAEGLVQRAPDDVDAGVGVAFQLDAVERLLGVEQRHAAAGHDAFLKR